MPQKFIKLNTEGNMEEQEALDSSSGSGDAGKVVALNTNGKIDPSMLPGGTLFEESAPATAGENLTKGDLVYLYDDNGTISCKRAKANNLNTACRGFVTQAYNQGDVATVFFEGVLIRDDMTFTVGKAYFLSNTDDGKPTDTPPQVRGSIIQRIGAAISSTEIQFERAIPIVHLPIPVLDGGNSTTSVVNAVDGGDSSGSNQESTVDGGDSSTT